MKRYYKLIFLATTILLQGFMQKGFAQQNYSSGHSCCWIASFMTKGADASSSRHFIRLADGSLWSFAPGSSLQQVAGIDHVIAIAANPTSFHIVVLKSDGTVWAWGDNDDEQLGNPGYKKAHSNVPLQVPGINHAISISTAGSACYALLANGTIMAWGRISHNGWATIVKWDKPTQLSGISNVIAISGNMALLSDGTVWTWGDGQRGRLGNGTTTSSAVPVQVKGIKNAVAISAREDGGMALLANGTVWTWGYNFNGELGNGNNPVNGKDANGTYSTIPVKVKGISNAIAISTNSNTCFALLAVGTLMGWGDGRLGGLIGHKAHVNKLPIKLPLHQVVSVQAGNFNGFALLANGMLMGWGSEMVAEGSYNQTYKPVVIAKLRDRAPVK
jgi:alpha-tubulin suppressor-like RCC1 family protein